jgi:hypothetical protein
MRPTRQAAGPLTRPAAWAGVLRCALTTVGMLRRGDLRWPRGNVGRRIRFADGSTGRVYRETATVGAAVDPCVLVVCFRLRAVRGRGHRWFRRESILNTPLFVGFPGFASKLWLGHDERGRYRGFYEWDGPERAERYARSLWRVLALVSEPGSIDYRVLPGLRRDEVLADPTVLDPREPVEPDAWWRPVVAA